MKYQFVSLVILPFLITLLADNQLSKTTRVGKDYALFFAVDDYKTSPDFDNLKNPIKDAEDLARELREMYQPRQSGNMPHEVKDNSKNM